MSDRPILFSAPMVRALLDGRKTQTRRVLKPQPTMHDAGNCSIGGHSGPVDYLMREIYPQYMARFRKGDRLYVREAWRMNEGGAINDAAGGQVDYVEPHIEFRADYGKPGMGWKPGIHMPRKASRLTLTVTDVRVQRLQECSAEDCAAEGACDSGVDFNNAQRAYRDIWEAINGLNSWLLNPWVVALTFTVERRNIDARAA